MLLALTMATKYEDSFLLQAVHDSYSSIAKTGPVPECKFLSLSQTFGESDRSRRCIRCGAVVWIHGRATCRRTHRLAHGSRVRESHRHRYPQAGRSSPRSRIRGRDRHIPGCPQDRSRWNSDWTRHVRCSCYDVLSAYHPRLMQNRTWSNERGIKQRSAACFPRMSPLSNAC